MKRALVSGGSGNIGRAVCKSLSYAGFHVIVHANQGLERAQTLARELREAGGSAEAISFDLTDGDMCERSLSHLLEEGPIQVLVHNAGIHRDAPFAGMSRQQWQTVIDVSLNGFFNICQPLLLPMMATRWGRVICVSSIAGVMGNRGQANYAAAKSGLHGAVKSLAIELASRGVTANAVAPGIIEGGMSEQVFDKATIQRLVPMQRAGTSQEVAALVAFLASDVASYISGQVISINGAMA